MTLPGDLVHNQIKRKNRLRKIKTSSEEERNSYEKKKRTKGNIRTSHNGSVREGPASEGEKSIAVKSAKK